MGAARREQRITRFLVEHKPENQPIVAGSQEDWDLAVRIMSSGRMRRLGEICTAHQGEVNETTDRNKGNISRNAEDRLRILRDANREIRRTIARRHTREEYLEWVETLGFRVRRYEPSVYCDALLLIAADKPSSRRAERPASSAVRSYLPGTVG